MKRLILAVLVMGLLMGCSGSTEQAKDQYMFEIEGQTIIIGENVQDTLSKIGDALKQYKSPSCAFEGEDNVYDYEKFQITTYLSNNTEVFTGVYILDESIQTKEGIHIGSTRQEMIDAYGEDYTEKYGAYTYNKGKTDLSFILVDDEITAISFLHIVD